MQNAVKHTEEGDIRLELTRDAAGLTMAVRDAGPGFDPGAPDHVGGLANMRQRCEESGGEFTLESGPAGTVVTCRIPVE